MLKQQIFNRRLNQQHGLTLIELMVSIVIFGIITIAVFSLYINANRTYNEDERFARLQENGRFALNLIASDLNMADFWGEMITPEFIDAGGVTFGADCNVDLEETDNSLRYYNATAATAATKYTPYTGTTICGTMGAHNAGTNALAIKRVANASTPSADVTNGTVYLRTNGFDGSFVDDAAMNASTTGYSDWLYVSSLYFIKDDADGVPYLCRAMASGTTAFTAIGNADDDCMAEGVEQLHIEFGIDTDNDGVANSYESDVTDTQIATAVTARVYLKVRSKNEILGYSNTKTYNLGNLGAITASDGYYRRVYNTTVTLRNPLYTQKF